MPATARSPSTRLTVEGEALPLWQTISGYDLPCILLMCVLLSYMNPVINQSTNSEALVSVAYRLGGYHSLGLVTPEDMPVGN